MFCPNPAAMAHCSWDWADSGICNTCNTQGCAKVMPCSSTLLYESLCMPPCWAHVSMVAKSLWHLSSVIYSLPLSYILACVRHIWVCTPMACFQSVRLLSGLPCWARPGAEALVTALLSFQSSGSCHLLSQLRLSQAGRQRQSVAFAASAQLGCAR